MKIINFEGLGISLNINSVLFEINGIKDPLLEMYK